MPEAPFTLPVHYVRHIADQIVSHGGDVARWLKESKLTAAQLASSSFELDYPTFERLVAQSLVVTEEPALGLFVGQRLVASTHGMLGYAALSSGTIGQALEICETFARLRLSLITMSRSTKGDSVRVRFDETRPLGEIRRPVLEAVVLSIKNILDVISMGACTVEEVSFGFAEPKYAAVARDLFGTRVRWGASWTGFSFPLDMLEVPLKMGDPGAFEEARNICQRELDKLTADESFSARVRRLLLEKQSGFPNLRVTARLFHTTPRTLHRRLLEEGTSYREILEEVRHALAVEHVKSGRFSMEEIAYSLGYSDLANFRRAFKRWESVPPSAYRRERVK